MAHPDFRGLTPTGRQMRDPAATLYELEGDDGRIYTSIAYDERYWGMDALTLNVKLVESFMTYPMVVGLVELERHDLTTATFSYPTGSIFTLTEVLRAYRDIGKAPGPRAALELTLLAAEILDEAGQAGPVQGCFSHGNLNPWRIAVRLDGELQVFGYGLAHVDLIAHRQDPSKFALAPESLRYAPPERIEGQPEGPSADIYSLTACAFEMATNRPLYDSLDTGELSRQIALSEGTTLLSGRGHGLPQAVARTFARALIYDPDTRLSGQEFIDEIRTLLDRQDVEGDGLVAIMDKMRGKQIVTAPRGRKLVAGTGTELFTAEQLRRQAEEDDDDDASSAQTGSQDSRWGKVARRRSDAPAAPSAVAAPPAAPEVADDGARRLRRRVEDPVEAAPAPPAPAGDDGGLRRRLRRGGDEAEPSAPLPSPAPSAPVPAAAAPASPASSSPPAEDGGGLGLRRLRRVGNDEAAPQAALPPVAPPAPPAEEGAGLRRLRRFGSEDPAAAAPAAPTAGDPEGDDGSLRRRLRRGVEGTSPEPAAPPASTAPPAAASPGAAAAPAEEDNPLRRRLRRLREGETEPPTDSPPEPSGPAPTEPAPTDGSPLRRLRRGG